ncbi:TetR/AcrR family transcriptional regulator [Lactococcus fujiensis]|uniref:Transcriptional regulator, TetR family n=1 Tax=Lactococcus fujiensis JCM 16395 TaxID=1291764 RepID=A0A2A5RP99_9LACT|nr:TetR/AcrR family transcriptional regulator [Lactococcus fujiensis]PCS01254.1 transcriptional regulator, TetR family [Lactococcus fujiensis JCM 16395]
MPKQERRRRGEVLISAIYEATIEILEQKGYEAVTFQNVARQAHTTRSVIYRYWDDPFHLIYEASLQHMKKNSNWQGPMIDHEFNSGALRTDLWNMMQQLKENATFFPKNFLTFLHFEQIQGKRTLEHLLPEVQQSNLIIIERILARAQERGEAREHIGQTAKMLPFQISRYHLLVDNQIISNDNIKKIVDEVLLPLYKK